MCSFTTKRPQSLLYTDGEGKKRRRADERDTNITGGSQWKLGEKMGGVAEGWGLEKREKKEDRDTDERKTSVLSSKLIKTCNCVTLCNMKDYISSVLTAQKTDKTARIQKIDDLRS